MITVKAGILPGRVAEWTLDAGDTVNTLVEVAELKLEGYEVKLNGSTITDLNTELANEDRIILTKKIKGN